MGNSINFQELIIRLDQFWADQGCLIWQPYSEKVGAGTYNSTTVLRVLGPEPWNVAYVEPSFRPDDGRFGENPNRMQMHTQYQVILKPDPGDPQELYLDSLEVLGLDRKQHDIRFVEDNWESPALGAWGLGWEVWLDGMEITQFTYFQQAGGISLNPVSVEITYGLERIAMYLQEVTDVWQLKWNNKVTYGDILKRQEVEYCEYEFNFANVKRLQTMYDLFEAEAKTAIGHNLVIPAHDYILRCSHTFNLLDSRGAIGVTDRARFFAQMRSLVKQIAESFSKQREELGYPFLKEKPDIIKISKLSTDLLEIDADDLLIEIGTEELPARDVPRGIKQLQNLIPKHLKQARLSFDSLKISGTSRRLFAIVKGLSGQQLNEERWIRGPAIKAAYSQNNNPTPALNGFCKGHGFNLNDIVIRKDDKGTDYVYALQKFPSLKATEILCELLPEMISTITFPKTMRWNSDNIVYSRPIRWIVALFGNQIIPFLYGHTASGRTSRGLRPDKSPTIELTSASNYLDKMEKIGIVADRVTRREAILKQVKILTNEINGEIPEDPNLLEEVTDLVEAPHALRGTFDEVHLELPQEILVTVMKKHQRYFPVFHQKTKHLMPYFITVSNGRPKNPKIVIRGNERVIRARYADATFFYQRDQKKPLADYLSKLDNLSFQEDLGSVLDKSHRIERLVHIFASDFELTDEEKETAIRAAQLCKADLATGMVVEITSLQGIMGRYYALSSGESEGVAQTIEDHYHPRFPGDTLPNTHPGMVVSVADRLDSLSGLFIVGIKPKANADPYGLRRDAIGLLTNLIHGHYHFSLRNGLEVAAKQLPVKVNPERLKETLKFILRRLEIQLKEEGFRHDVVTAAIGGGSDDPYEIQTIAKGLTKMVQSKSWMDTFHAYARCKRIVRDFPDPLHFDPEVDREIPTQELYKVYQKARKKIDAADEKILILNRVLRDIQNPINRFFDEILVMDKKPSLRQSRLALLQKIAALPDNIANLSYLEGF